MHRLFTIEHLIHEICSYVSDSELPILARVSSSWFRCAVPRLYKNLLIQEALGPLGEIVDEDETIKFVKTPSDEDFKRLLKYSSHVRALEMIADFVSITLEAMCKSVTASEGVSYLFSNLRDLDWRYPEYSPESMEVACGLISPKIERLSLFIKDHRILRYLSPLVISRVSALRDVIIIDRTETAGDSTESPLATPVQDLLTFFTNTLKHVHISSHSLNNPAILKCLSKMPNLSSLGIGGGSYTIDELKRSEKYGEIGNFPSQRSFTFVGPPQSFHDMFSIPYDRASLTTLEFYVKFGPANVCISIPSIVAACPHLRSLTVIWLSDVKGPYTWPVVPWSFIQPISSCKFLNSLSLYSVHVSVSLEELTEFLKNRTTWTRLHIWTLSPLRLQDMLLYSKHCPNLEHLGIRINLNDRDELYVEDLPNDIPSFTTLNSIHFAGSHITESTSRALAQLLCRICKKPPDQLAGLDDKIIDDILRNLAISYMNESTGKPISSEIRKFVNMMVMRKMPA